MCLIPSAPKPQVLENTNSQAQAAADGLMMSRANAQGYAASLMGFNGNSASQPSLARQSLGFG